MDYIDSLGAHTTHQEAVQARNALDEILTTISQKRDEKRRLESSKQDREMELLQNEASKHPDHSVAAMERHLKVVHHSDPDLMTLRTQLRQVNDDLDGLDFDRAMAETDIKIAVSRLNELGGLFQFMAVIKQADEARKASEAKTEQFDDPWRI